MKPKCLAFLLLILLAGCQPGAKPIQQPASFQGFTIDRQLLLDKIEGGWVGQMAGVAWGAPTEFSCQGEILYRVPFWESENINTAFSQDDLYVELPFMEAMKEHGVNASWTVFGDYFEDTRFRLWHANDAARRNLKRGLPAPDSGHYANNPHADDIDWQIEADFAGLVAPGQPQVAIDIAWRAGHVMNYGDGVYGGVAVAAMHAAAFFAQDVNEIVEAGRQAVPQGSAYRQVIEDLIAWHAENPSDWKAAWRRLQDKWGSVDRCPDGVGNPFNIDAKLNGAYVFMGLLYGDGDFEESMRIAMRCGQDSDCNPSSVGGILGSWLGLSKIPDKFKAQLDPANRFSYTQYSYRDVIELSMQLARSILLQRGGHIDASGEGEVWSIPASSPLEPPILEQWPAQPVEPPAITALTHTIEGQQVTFDALASHPEGILAYQWFFGDLSYASGKKVTHTYLSPGKYEVILYLASPGGNTSWKSILIDIPK